MKENKQNLINYLKKSKIPIILTIIFLILAFGERLINNSFSMDTEFYINHWNATLNWSEDFDWWIGLNRWGLVAINKLLSIGPLVIFQSNFLTMCFIEVYSILFMYLFYLYIPKSWQENYLKVQFIFPIIFITNPIFAEQYNFINQNVGVSLGIVFCALSALLLYYGDKEEKWKKYILNTIAIVLAVFSFGIYQSMVPLYILIIACTYFLKCLKEKNSCWKFLGNRIVKFIIICILYLIVSKIIGGENSYLQMGWTTYGLGSIKNIYKVMLSVLRSDTIFYNISYILAIIIIVGINIYLLWRKKNNLGIILSSIGLLLAPFYIIIITGIDQLKRTQFNYSFVIGFIILIGCLLLLNHKKVKYLGYIIVILAIGIAYQQSVITGRLFYSDSVRFASDTTLANKIQTTIESKDWYNKEEDYTLVIVGQKPCTAVNFYEKGEVIGYSFFEFDYEYIYGPSQRANAFMKTLGYDYQEPTQEQFDQAKEYVKEHDTESFPKEDSIIEMNDNVIVVRLSEEI